MAIYSSGTIINNRYEVILGPKEKPSLAGGMGFVYFCVDHVDNDHPLALKTFKPEYIRDRMTRDLFLREGTTWVELGRYPHIVRCFEVIKNPIGSDVFLVLELVAGKKSKTDASIRSLLIADRSLSIEQALTFALQIARGMRYASTKIPGLIHRDLKPENILVGYDGNARITDFGLAGIISSFSEELFEQTQKDQLLSHRRSLIFSRGFTGTPEYASPEQFIGKELDERSDIYALGCILYEMLTGQAPYAPAYEMRQGWDRFLKLKQCHVEEEPERPKRLVPTLPDGVQEIVIHCMKKETSERYENWEEVEIAITNTYRNVVGKDPSIDFEMTGDSHTDRIQSGWSFSKIGESYLDISKFDVAKKYFEKVLSIAIAEKERPMEAAALGNLASVFLHVGNVEKAIRLYEQDCSIVPELGNHQDEAIVLGNIGSAHLKLGDPGCAIKFFEQSLSIVRQIGDKHTEGALLGNLGNAYGDQGEIHKAIEFYEQQLNIAREMGDRRLQIAAMGNLAHGYQNLGKLAQAIDIFEQVLKITQEIGDRKGEGQTLDNLGLTYKNLGDLERALEFYNQSLFIMREINDLYGEEQVLGNLGNIYKRLGQLTKAIDLFEQVLTIAQKIGDRRGEGLTYGNLGNIYGNLGDMIKAKEYYEKDLAIAREIENKHGEGYALGNLGNVYKIMGDITSAIDCYEQHLQIANKIGDTGGAAMKSGNLALLLAGQGRFAEALGHAEFTLTVFTKMGNMSMIQRANQLIARIKAQL